MSKNSIGGFFVDLGMNIDKNSFETGNKYIDDLGNGFNRVTGLARNAAVVLATTAIAGSSMSSAEIKVAEALGVATENLDKWKAAIRIAGGNVGGFISELGQLASVIAHAHTDAAGLEQLAYKLSFLKINVSDLIEMNPDEAYRKIIETAQERITEGEDPFIIYNKIKDVLGTSGQGFLIELQRRGMGVDEALGNASKTQFQTQEGKNAGADFIAEIRTINTSIASLTRAFGDDLGKVLEPAVKDISKWITDNGDGILTTLTIVATGIGSLIEITQPLFEIIGQLLGTTVTTTSQLLTGVNAYLNGDKKGAKQQISNIKNNTPDIIDPLIDQVGHSLAASVDILRAAKSLIHGDFNSAKSYAFDFVNNGKEMAKDTGNFVMQGYTTAKQAVTTSKEKKVDDGIIQPNGQVTQVAQDDWVFAVKNIDDLAGAFSKDSSTNSVTTENTYIYEAEKETTDNKIGTPIINETIVNNAEPQPLPIVKDNKIGAPIINEQILAPREEYITTLAEKKDTSSIAPREEAPNINIRAPQINSEDWMFEAKKIGEIAKAFVPQAVPSQTTNNAQYSIVQNFTVNGGRDLPQTIKQQAYKGTQSALFESLTQSGRRLQQMSGTR